MNGFFNIDKPTGMTSAAVVAVMRRLTGEKRVGHAGTLDPEAAGVLPIMIGKAARLFDYLADKEKEYFPDALNIFASEYLHYAFVCFIWDSILMQIYNQR